MKRKDLIPPRLRGLFFSARSRESEDGGSPLNRASFRLLYERFREILALNDSVLEVIADIEDRLSRGRPFSLEVMGERVRRAAMDVFVMVKNLNLITEGRHEGLYEALRGLNREIEAELEADRAATEAPLALSLDAIEPGLRRVTGAKMANLAEARSACGALIPGGFVITTAAAVRFLSLGDLWGQCLALEEVLERGGLAALAEASAQVRREILGGTIPAEVTRAIEEAFDTCFPGPGALVSLRSSAVGEDASGASHAGLYRTELRVDRVRLLDAYRSVVASAFSPAAVSYRFQKGLTAGGALMAVGCLRMIAPRCAGTALSRSPREEDRGVVTICAIAGVADGITGGSEDGETIRVGPGEGIASGGLLSPEEADALAVLARRLEEHFGCPQEIEWAIDPAGVLYLLQTRPAVAERPSAERATGQPPPSLVSAALILAGGVTACSGVGSGPPFVFRNEADLALIPEGGVLLARHSAPDFAQVMTRCAAIVTEVGSPAGHMASLAREFGVPAIVGLAGALAALASEEAITVDAAACRIYRGSFPDRSAALPRAPSLHDSPAVDKMRRLSRLITPLGLTDPVSAGFRPEGCRSLHDCTRFVHEKVFEAMFHYGDQAAVDRQNSLKLEARLPIAVRIFDLGGSLSPDAGRGGRVRVSEITGVPLLAFLEGLMDERIRWDLPRPISVRGFLSVLGESMTGPPAETLRVGRLSYAIASDRYLNFSTKAGYHFSTLDTYCGRSQNRNYIHFRFMGGAAELSRRQRRIQFLSAVLGALDFRVQARDDLLTARLDKYGDEIIRSRLVDLGRLTLCARQLDMLMDADSSAEVFAGAFLEGEWDRF